MRNAFEKITAIHDGGRLEILHTSKHAGTLCSFARKNETISDSDHEKERQSITEENARQAKEWIGDKILHCNTFNSGIDMAVFDPQVVSFTKKAIEDLGGRISNTAIYDPRYLTFAHITTGAKQTLKDLYDTLKSDKFAGIKSYLRDGISGNKEVSNLPNIEPKTAEILKTAVELRDYITELDKIFRYQDAENTSLAASSKLNKLVNLLSNLKETPEGMETLPQKEEILNMCTSGKDRTGTAQHDQSIRAIAEKIGTNLKDIESQLIAGGHTSCVPGGVFIGGCTIGCFGTATLNWLAIPEDRRDTLGAIVEKSADGAKIRKIGNHFDRYKRKEDGFIENSDEFQRTKAIVDDIVLGKISSENKNKLNKLGLNDEQISVLTIFCAKANESLTSFTNTKHSYDNEDSYSNCSTEENLSDCTKEKVDYIGGAP